MGTEEGVCVSDVSVFSSRFIFLKGYAGESGFFFKLLARPLASMITSVEYWLWNLIIDFVKSVLFGDWLGGTFFRRPFLRLFAKN